MNRAKNVNAKHAYLLHRSSGRNKKVAALEPKYGQWKEQFMQEARQTGVHSHSANEFGVCHKTKRPFKRFNGLVSGQHKSERSLPIGNPCDAELSSLMRCMKEHDYDNIPCLDLQQTYLSCTKTALDAYKVKREGFLRGEKTDGMYSQNIINSEFKKIKQPQDYVQWKMQCYYLKKWNYDFQPPNLTDKATKEGPGGITCMPHICEVPRDLNFTQTGSKTGRMKKDLSR